MDENGRPYISVILCGWERLDFLTEAIESVFKQTFPLWELVIMDQKEITHRLAPLLSQHSFRIKIFPGMFDSPAKAQQYGVEHSGGEYLTFLDDDNQKHPDFFEKMLDFALKINSPFVVCNSVVINSHRITESGVICRTPKPAYITLGLLRTDNYIDNGEIFVSRKFFNSLGGFDLSLMGFQDWTLSIKAAKALAHRGGIPVLHESLHSYRIHKDQLTFRVGMAPVWEECRKRIRETYFQA